jgi:diacylglycerol O-acyltransferase
MNDSQLAWGDEVSAMDYLMVRGETDPRFRSSIMSVEILDRVPDWYRLRRTFDRASRVVVRLRQRVIAPAVPIGNPRWVVDPDFDLDYHLRRIACPQPGALRQLQDLAQPMLAAPLDTARPLWEATLIEGVSADGGQAALVCKWGHAIADGLGAMVLDRQLRDFARDPEPRSMPPLPAPETLTGSGLARANLQRLPGTVLSGTGRSATSQLAAAGRVMRHPAAAVSDVSAFARSLRRIASGPAVEPSPLLRRRSLGRRLDSLAVPFGDLRAAAKAVGSSVNDAYIAALCGGLRLYHERLGVPVAAVPMSMPVSLRTPDDPAGGNRWGVARLAAPVGEEDPVARLRTIRQIVLAARAEPAINAPNALAPLLARAPAELLTRVASTGISTDVQASNVPGHTQPSYIAGARVLRLCPFGPLPGAALMVVMFSLADTCFVGIHSDTASVTDPELFACCLRQGFDEVMALARPHRGTAAVA